MLRARKEEEREASAKALEKALKKKTQSERALAATRAREVEVGDVGAARMESERKSARVDG